jgi:quercetin dioxygenase-like cupin family protein
VNCWDLNSLTLRPHSPEILSTSDEARAVTLEIPAGESLSDHQVHERAWVVVVGGEVEISTPGGQSISGGSGVLVEFAPGERHAVTARTDARLLLLLTPWPGEGHPGTMSLEDKAHMRERAAEHNHPTGEAA